MYRQSCRNEFITRLHLILYLPAILVPVAADNLTTPIVVLLPMSAVSLVSLLSESLQDFNELRLMSQLVGSRQAADDILHQAREA